MLWRVPSRWRLRIALAAWRWIGMRRGLLILRWIAPRVLPRRCRILLWWCLLRVWLVGTWLGLKPLLWWVLVIRSLLGLWRVARIVRLLRLGILRSSRWLLRLTRRVLAGWRGLIRWWVALCRRS